MKILFDNEAEKRNFIQRFSSFVGDSALCPDHFGIGAPRDCYLSTEPTCRQCFEKELEKISEVLNAE